MFNIMLCDNNDFYVNVRVCFIYAHFLYIIFFYSCLLMIIGTSLLFTLIVKGWFLN